MPSVFEHLIHSDALFLCDLQEDYAYKVGNDFQEVVNNSTKTLKAALQFGISVALTALQGMGQIVTEIQRDLPEFREKMIVKIRFSMCSSPLMDSFQDKSCMFLCGFETHEAMKDTALDLMKLGFSVVVVTDACSSAFSGDGTRAFEDLEGEGCHLMTVSEALVSIRTFSTPPKKDHAIDAKSGKTSCHEMKGKEKRHEEDLEAISGDHTEEHVSFKSHKSNSPSSDDSGHKTRKSIFENGQSSSSWDETDTSSQRTLRFRRRRKGPRQEQSPFGRRKSQLFTKGEKVDRSKSRGRRSATVLSSSEKVLEKERTNVGFVRVRSAFDVQMNWKRSDRTWKRQVSSRLHKLERNCAIQ